MSESEGEDDSEESECEPDFNVESIVDSKKEGRKTLYLVKWEGFDDTDNTWEPASNIPKNNLALVEFLANN